MENFKQLSRAEMKNVLGGLVKESDCEETSECSSDSDCDSGKDCIQVTCMGGKGTYGACSS